MNAIESEIPLFTVVIPLYNKADTIRRTIESVIAQNFRDFEILVVDDGSTDGGDDIVRMFVDDHRVRYLRQRNAGVSAARNRGITEARGRYIAFIDADDEWQVGFLRAIAQVINKYSIAKVIGSGYERRDRKYTYSCRRRKKIYICNLFDVWPYFQPINMSSIVIEKKLLLHIGGYRENLSLWEDGELWFRIARTNPFYVIRAPLSRYNNDALISATRRNHQTQTSSPHIDLLRKWVAEGSASISEKRCLRLVLVNQGSSRIEKMIFWVYKRIRFYLWFKRIRNA